MKNNNNNNNNLKENSNPQLPVYDEKRPSSLKSNWINDLMAVTCYGLKKEEVTEIWKSKGKSIVLFVDGKIAGYRNFPPEANSTSQEHIEYISFTSPQIEQGLPDKDKRAREVKMMGLLSGSTGIFGKAFLACKSLAGRSGRYITKENQKTIASKFEAMITKEGK